MSSRVMPCMLEGWPFPDSTSFGRSEHSKSSFAICSSFCHSTCTGSAWFVFTTCIRPATPRTIAKQVPRMVDLYNLGVNVFAQYWTNCDEVNGSLPLKLVKCLIFLTLLKLLFLYPFSNRYREILFIFGVFVLLHPPYLALAWTEL